MESVVDSVRSWRDLTAGLLPRVASAAQLEAKRLAHCSQVSLRNERVLVSTLICLHLPRCWTTSSALLSDLPSDQPL